MAVTENLVAQIPDTFRNLQFFAEDISRDSLLDVMRGFSFSLGVRCQYCHVGGDGISFEGVEFHSDDDPDKRKARYMLRLVADLNERLLPQMPDRTEPNVRMECKTCHRGRAKPFLLTQELRLTLEAHGVDSAISQYRQLREEYATSGTFDFGEWEMNVLAERLTGEGRLRDAIAIYELNAEFFPGSFTIVLNLARLYDRAGDIGVAIERYERVLEMRPEHAPTQARLAELRRGR